MKLDICHVDTCLPDYWRGHHKAHLSIPVYRGITMKEIKRQLMSELAHGAIMGSDTVASFLACEYCNPEDEKFCISIHKAAMAAINRLKPAIKGKRKFFLDLEENQEDDDCTVYAYFVFVEL